MIPRTHKYSTLVLAVVGLTALAPPRVTAQDRVPAQDGQSAAAITVWDALRMVEGDHPILGGLDARRAAIDAERAGVTLLGAPTVTYAREGVEGSDFVEQRVVFAGTVSPFSRASARRAVLASSRDAVGFDMEASRVALRAQIKQAFIDIQYGDELVALRTNAVELASRLLEAATLREEVGEASGFETLRAQLELERAAAALKRAERDRAEAGTSAKLAAGISTSAAAEATTVASPGPLGFTRIDVSLAEVAAGSTDQPDRSAASKRVDAARASLREERTALLPDLHLEFFPQDLGDGFNTYGFTVGLRLPVLLWPATRPRQRAARAAIIEQQRAEEYVAISLAAAAESAWRRYDEAAAAAVRYRDTMQPRSEELLFLAEEGYRAGQVSLTALLDARRAYVEESILYLDTLRVYLKSAVDLERFVGRDLVFVRDATN